MIWGQRGALGEDAAAGARRVVASGRCRLAGAAELPPGAVRRPTFCGNHQKGQGHKQGPSQPAATVFSS